MCVVLSCTATLHYGLTPSPSRSPPPASAPPPPPSSLPLPFLLLPLPSPPTLSGFRDEDADFSDLLSQGGAGFGSSPLPSSSLFSAPPPPLTNNDDDDGFGANPFADMESSSYMPYSSSAVEQEQGQEQPSPFYQVPAVSSSAMGGGGGYDELRKEQQQEDLEEQTPFQSIPDDDDEQIQIPFQREADMDVYLPPPIPTALPTLDMSSSSTSHGGFEPSTPSSPGGFGGFTPASPTSALLSSDLTSNATPRDRSFSRESAPAPETPVPAAGLPSSFRHQPYSPHHSAPPPPPQEPLHAPGDPDAFTYNPYAPSHYTTTRAAPTPSSPPTEDAFPNSSRRAKVGAGARGDLSVLLGGAGGEGSPGKGKGKEREKKGGGNLLGKGGKVGTLGRGKKGQGALAALLGMEEEERKEESKKEVKEAQKEDEEVKVKKEEEEVKKEEKEEPVAEPAPLPPSSPAVAAPSPLAHLALDTPLPPSRGASPPPASSSSAPSSPSKTSQHSSKPSLDRTASLAPSLSVGYDALVSPLETGETPRADTGTEGDGEKAWPENKAVALEEEGSEKEKEGEKEEDGTAKIDEKLAALKVADEEKGTNPTPAKPEDVTLPSPSSASAEEPLPPSSSAPESPFSSTADLPPSSSTTTADTPSDPTYQQYIFSSSSSPPPSISTSTDSAPPRSENGTISSTRGFRTFNDTEEDDGEGFGGLGGGGRVGEADSLRGTYSRSLEEEQEGEEEGESTPTTERTEGFGGGGFGGEAQGQAVQRVQREVGPFSSSSHLSHKLTSWTPHRNDRRVPPPSRLSPRPYRRFKAHRALPPSADRSVRRSLSRLETRRPSGARSTWRRSIRFIQFGQGCAFTTFFLLLQLPFRPLHPSRGTKLICGAGLGRTDNLLRFPQERLRRPSSVQPLRLALRSPFAEQSGRYRSRYARKACNRFVLSVPSLLPSPTDEALRRQVASGRLLWRTGASDCRRR